jgi:hypothetical protein
MWRFVISWKLTDVSEVRTASIIRAIIVLIMEAVCISETPVFIYEATRGASQKAVNFILATVRT